jgi:uncharacterized protein (DUF362 family)
MNKKPRTGRSKVPAAPAAEKKAPQSGKNRRKHSLRHTAAHEASVVIVNQNPRLGAPALLEDTLLKAGFWECIKCRQAQTGKQGTAFRIVIKPDLEIFAPNASTGTDPGLVEYLISLLYGRGYENVSIVDGVGSSDCWLENREPTILADLAGYRYLTADGKPYSIVNLNENLVDAGFGPDTVLFGSSLGAQWLEADFRISFAKNKTHQEYGYSLGLRSIISVLPLRDKEYHYFHRLPPADVCRELLEKTPINFAIIDAIVSNHGSDGIFRSNPITTNTIIAGENIIVGDFAGACKMGLDPYLSSINSGVLRQSGLPENYDIQGDLTPYAGWQNIPMALSDSVRRRNRSVMASRLAQTWLQTVDRDVFPFKNDIDERINSTISKLMHGMDKHPLGMLGATGLNYLLAYGAQSMEAYSVLFNKRKIPRRRTSLAIDLSRYSDKDYEKMTAYLKPLEKIAVNSPADRNGLRWRYLDHSVVFSYSRILPIPFSKFISRVDISAAVRTLNDTIGGGLTVVARDEKGRPTRQAERNIYLPQPNWMALFGGEVIDVDKIEFISYEPDRQRIFWKAVHSANQSALVDDGIITFSSARGRSTEITIMARQEFNLPLLFQILNIDYLPHVKDALVSDSYTTFFSRSIANFEAAFEGRDPLAGHDWDIDAGEQSSEKPWIPIEKVVDTAFRFAEGLQPIIKFLRQNGMSPSHPLTGADASAETDGRKEATSMISRIKEAAQGISKEFFEAVKKDASMMGKAPWEGMR